MLKNVSISVLGGLLTIISMLFACRNDLDTVLNGPTLQPIMNIFYLAFTKVSDNGMSDVAPIYPTLLTIFLIFLNLLNGFSKMTTTTRICYALGRDGAMPGRDWIT